MSKDRDITVLIAACDAAATIGRAIHSVTAQSACSIIIVDDFCSDDTIAIARRYGGARLKVVRPIRHQSLGLTRQTGLDAVETPYTMLMDADDALLPGRVRRSVDALAKSGYEVYTDPVFLREGLTGRLVRKMEIPAFLKVKPIPVRLFERNHLPGIGQIVFRTDFARGLGYDVSLHGAEDVDLVLRMVEVGGRFHFDSIPGYLMYAYPRSLSRNLEDQREMYRRCLSKFSYERVRTLYLESGEIDRVANWALVSMATYRGEFRKALSYLDEIIDMPLTDPFIVLEPKGSCPLPEAWRIAFHRGTLLLLEGRDKEAFDSLEIAHRICPLPEVCNNLAVACGRVGRPDGVPELLHAALSQDSRYLDARMNQSAHIPGRITTHPLRCHANRSEY